MRVDLHFTPDSIKPDDMSNRLAVVVDVLRASTTICTALRSGCKAIIPCDEVERARNIHASLGPEGVLLCGERGGEKLPGFDLGNSPAEYTTDVVGGMTLIFASTNGSRTLVKVSKASRVLVAGFVNLSTIEQVIRNTGKDLLIVCSGKLGNFAYEDAFCGGALIDRLLKYSEVTVGNDAARAALKLYKSESRPLLEAVSEADHAVYLSSLGFAEDLRTASEIDSIPVLPELSDGRIVLSENKNG